MTIQALHSDIILHVPDGVYGIILGNIHTDHWRFRYLVPEKDCIISPMREYFIRGNTNQRGNYKIEVPHIVPNITQLRDKIKVRYQHKIDDPFVNASLTRSPQKLHDPQAVYFDVNRNYIEIITHQFTRFLVTAEAIICCSRSVQMLVFSSMKPIHNPYAEVRFYFGSPLYKYKDYRQVCKDKVFMSSLNYLTNQK